MYGLDAAGRGQKKSKGQEKGKKRARKEKGKKRKGQEKQRATRKRWEWTPREKQRHET